MEQPVERAWRATNIHAPDALSCRIEDVASLGARGRSCTTPPSGTISAMFAARHRAVLAASRHLRSQPPYVTYSRAYEKAVNHQVQLCMAASLSVSSRQPAPESPAVVSGGRQDGPAVSDGFMSTRRSGTSGCNARPAGGHLGNLDVAVAKSRGLPNPAQPGPGRRLRCPLIAVTSSWWVAAVSTTCASPSLEECRRSCAARKQLLLDTAVAAPRRAAAMFRQVSRTS